MAGILPPLAALLKSPQDNVRMRAADAIGKLADLDIGDAVVETGWPVFCIRTHVLRCQAEAPGHSVSVTQLSIHCESVAECLLHSTCQNTHCDAGIALVKAFAVYCVWA